MEKLLNLLNKYDKSENVNAYRWEIEGGDIIGYNRFRGGYETINVSESVIISKWYEFIKRLVDKDKIDLEKLLKAIKENKIYCGKWGKTRNMLLMLLAIQDEPINFLVSILK